MALRTRMLEIPTLPTYLPLPLSFQSSLTFLSVSEVADLHMLNATTSSSCESLFSVPVLDHFITM